jgi:hypothetical protein
VAPQLAGESQGGTSITVTRLAPRIAMASPPPPSISLVLDPARLLASTALSRASARCRDRVKRKRKYTKAYKPGREQGVLTSLGHSRHQDWLYRRLQRASNINRQRCGYVVHYDGSDARSYKCSLHQFDVPSALQPWGVLDFGGCWSRVVPSRTEYRYGRAISYLRMLS